MFESLLTLVTGPAQAVGQYLKDDQARKALERMLAVELRYNLDLLQLLPQAGGNRVPPDGKEDLSWRLDQLSTAALEAWLSLEDNPAEALIGKLSTKSDSDKKRKFKSLVEAASFIVVRIRLLRAAAAAPVQVKLPGIRWEVRRKNLVEAHLAALTFLSSPKEENQ